MKKWWLAVFLALPAAPAWADCDAAYKDAMINVIVDKSQTYTYYGLRTKLDQIKNDKRDKGWSVDFTKSEIGKALGLKAGSKDIDEIYDRFIEEKEITDIKESKLDIYARSGAVDVARLYNQCREGERGGIAFSTLLLPSEAQVQGTLDIPSGLTAKFDKFVITSKSKVACPLKPSGKRGATLQGKVVFDCNRASGTDQAVITLAIQQGGAFNAIIPERRIVVAPSLCKSPGAVALGLGKIYRSAKQILDMTENQITWSSQEDARNSFAAGTQDLARLGFIETDYPQHPSKIMGMILDHGMRGPETKGPANNLRHATAEAVLDFGDATAEKIRGICT